ncbi:MAG: transposase [Chloroflexota bacterium]
MLNAKNGKGRQAKTILFDSWYAGVDNLKLIIRLGMGFVTTLKSNRIVSLTPESVYVHLQDLVWTAEQLEHGLSITLKELPFRGQLFKVVATNGDFDWIITNHPEGTMTTHAIQTENAVRWQIEPLHRELKQLTGSEKCECRKARSQRSPIGACFVITLGWRFGCVPANLRSHYILYSTPCLTVICGLN